MGMKRANNFLVFVALTVGALVSVLAPGASAQTGSISGVILDLNAKPWPGVYDVTVISFPPPNDKQPPYQMAKVRVQSGEDAKADANFKEVLAKQGAVAQEQAKKQEEEKQKFQEI